MRVKSLTRGGETRALSLRRYLSLFAVQLFVREIVTKKQLIELLEEIEEDKEYVTKL